MRNYVTFVIIGILFFTSIFSAFNHYSIVFDYAEDLANISEYINALQWLVLFGIMTSFLVVVVIALANILTQYKYRVLRVLMVLIIITNMFFSFIATSWIQMQIISDRCDLFLSRGDLQKIYDEKILNVFAELQKQDSKFKSISLKPLEGRLTYCQGIEILVIKYDGTMNDVELFSIVEQKLHGILDIREYDFSTSDEPGGRYQLFK